MVIRKSKPGLSNVQSEWRRNRVQKSLLVGETVFYNFFNNQKSMKKQYQTTKKECQIHLSFFGNVCDRCGRKLKPMETVDNSGNPTYWAGCYHGNNEKGAWGHFTHGVKKEIFDLAEKMVCDGQTYYGHSKADYNKTIKDKLFWFQTEVSGICGLLQKIEYLKNNNPLKTKKEFLQDKYF